MPPHDAYDSIRQSIRDVQNMLREEFNHGESCESTRGEDDQARIGLIEDEAAEADGAVMSVMQETKIWVAIDSGAVRSVAHPSVMPVGIKITPNIDGEHFSGAGGEAIERFSECETLLTGADSQINGRWSLADVYRPLHSVSQIT